MEHSGPCSTNKSSQSHKRLSDQGSFIGVRLGPEFLEYFPNSQFPKAGLDQFFKKLIPGVMDDENVIVDALAALLERIGPAILVSHSQSGRFAYLTAIRSPNVKVIVDYEGANQPFPSGASACNRSRPSMGFLSDLAHLCRWRIFSN